MTGKTPHTSIVNTYLDKDNTNQINFIIIHYLISNNFETFDDFNEIIAQYNLDD